MFCSLMIGLTLAAAAVGRTSSGPPAHGNSQHLRSRAAGTDAGAGQQRPQFDSSFYKPAASYDYPSSKPMGATASMPLQKRAPAPEPRILRGRPKRARVHRHLSPNEAKVLKKAGYVGEATMTAVCAAGLILPPPADVIIEAGCITEMIGEAAGKGIKKEVDKKKGIAPTPPLSSGAGGTGEKVLQKITHGNQEEEKVIKGGLRGLRFLSKVHV